MKTFTLNELTLVTSRGKQYAAELDKWSDAHIAFLVQYAFSVLVQRASASDKTDEARAASEAKKAEQIARGETPSGKGPRGPRLGFEALAEREIVMDLLTGVVGLAKGKAAEAVKGLDTAWEEIARVVIIDQLKAAGKDPKQAPIKALVSTNLDTIRDSFAAKIEARASELKLAHEEETKRAAAAKAAVSGIAGLKL